MMAIRRVGYWDILHSFRQNSDSENQIILQFRTMTLKQAISRQSEEFERRKDGKMEMTIGQMIENLKDQMQQTNADYISMTMTFDNEPYMVNVSLNRIREREDYKNIANEIIEREG